MIEHISQSMLNMWTRCGEQFRRRYIEGDIIPPKLAARIGTGLHEGARVNHQAKRTTRRDEPLSVVQDAARDGYVKAIQDGVFFPPDEVAGAKVEIANGVDTTVKLAKLYHESLAPQVQPKLVEEALSFEVVGLPLPFRGIIDCLDENGWWFDIKSADKKWANGRADTEIQATLYNELIAQTTGLYPTKMTFEVFTKTKAGEHVSYTTTRTLEDFALLVQAAQRMVRSIQAGIFPPAIPGYWLCSESWCGFWASCPCIPTRLKRRKA